MAADETSLVPSAAPAELPATAPVASVARERTHDPLTGLPVLRYRFTGLPTLHPGDPAPAGAWRVLRADSRDGATSLDLEAHAGAEPLTDLPASVDDLAAEAALATAADARRLGVGHGDLGAHRLWRRGDRIWVEGYGVPWRTGATPEADERALAADLLAIAGTRLGAAMRARLAAVRDGGDPAAVVTPVPVPDATPPRPAGPPAPPSPTAPGLATPADDPSPRPAVVATDSGPPAAGPVATTPSPRLVEGPPPDAAPRPGAGEARHSVVPSIGGGWPAGASAVGGGVHLPHGLTRRHAVLALALVLSAGAWAGLASWSPPGPIAASFVSRVVGHVVDVRIEPPGLPPVSLVVVESPPGSRLPPGTVVGSVPSKVLLDRDGVWRFQARFGGTSSQIVVLVAPDEPGLVVPFPSPAAAP